MNRQFPLFSIILPTYNRARHLSAAIQSVVDQSVTDWELLVVDDGSTDETNVTIKKFHDNRIKYCRQEHNERSVARNLGISLSTGKYICFLDDDDEYKLNHLQVFFDHLTDDEAPGHILRTGYITQGEIDSEQISLYTKSSKTHPVKFFSNEMCGIWSLCIPRQYLVEHQFHSDFPHWQDTHLILRLLAIYPFTQLNNWTYIYKQHKEMGSRYFFKGNHLLARVELQVAAIDHLFSHYKKLMSPFLSETDRRRMVAEKYIRGSTLLRQEGRLLESMKLLRKAPFSFTMLPSRIKSFFLLCMKFLNS